MAAPKRVLFIPDTHVPFEDKRAWGVMLNAAAVVKPDVLVHLGDFGDCYSVSDHLKDPRRLLSWSKEADAVKRRRAEMDDIGAKRKVFCAGNHEHRLERHLAKAAPALYDRLSIDSEYELTKHGWEFYAYGEHAKVGKVYCTHDSDTAGATANIKARDEFQHNTVIGHTHWMSTNYRGNAVGEQHVGCSFGWLGDVRKIDYLKRVKARRWTLGFGLGLIEASGVVHLTAVPIINYRANVYGRLVGA